MITSEVLDDLVAYVPATSQAVSLNVSARAVWELCDGARTLEDICSELSEVVAMSPSDLRSDVQSALDRLREPGLLAD